MLPHQFKQRTACTLILGALAFTATTAAANDLYLYQTKAAYHGGFGGVSSADKFCNSDANKPNNSTYKALLVVPNVRQVCDDYGCGAPGLLDWVLLPQQKYITSQGYTIGVTNEQAYFPSMSTVYFPNVWLGIIGNGNWRAQAKANCSNWSVGSKVKLPKRHCGSAKRAQTGSFGFEGHSDYCYLHAEATDDRHSDSCPAKKSGHTHELLCAEQPNTSK